MSNLWLDIRYALRMMLRAPGLTTVLVVTLALGIGASTTIFSVVNSVLLKPLPYKDSDRIVRVYTEFINANSLPKFWMSNPEYADLAKACRTCDGIAAWANGSAVISGGDRPIRVDAAWSTQSLADVLGVKPMLGRWWDPSEDRPGADLTVVVIGYDVWQRAFNGDPAIIGTKITVDAIPVSIIGVMPKGFDFLGRQEAWVPLHMDAAEDQRGSHNLNVITRIKAGESLASMRAEFAALVAEWGKTDGPQRHMLKTAEHPLLAVPFQADLVGGIATSLWMLQGAVLFVLLISVVNIANLLLARSEARNREVAIRHALGANRRRLMRQFITESLLLGLFGGALGVLVSVWSVDAIAALIPRSATRVDEIQLDAAAVIFAAACAIGAALLFGIAPILHARKTDVHSGLKDGSNRMTGTRARLRVRRALVIVEIVLAVVLVASCIVMVRSFLKLQRVDLGFDPKHLLVRVAERLVVQLIDAAQRVAEPLVCRDARHVDVAGLEPHVRRALLLRVRLHGGEQETRDARSSTRRIDIEMPEHEARVPRLVLDRREADDRARVLGDPRGLPARPERERILDRIALEVRRVDRALDELDAARLDDEVEDRRRLERGIDRLDSRLVRRRVVTDHRHARASYTPMYPTGTRWFSGDGRVVTA
jgi:putative ABC transport system permease protein